MAEEKNKNRKSYTLAKVVGFGTGGIALFGVAWWLLQDDIKELFSKKKSGKDSGSTIVSTPVPTSSSASKPKKTTKKTESVKAKQEPPKYLTDAEALAVAKEIREANYIVYRVPSQKEQAYVAGLKKLISALLKIKNVQDYVSVNTHFLKIGFDLVRKSIVTKSFEVYGSFGGARATITDQFLRMGLKHNPDGKWALAGLGNIGCPKHTVESVYGLCELTGKEVYAPAKSYIGNEFARDTENGVSYVISSFGTPMLYPSKSLI